MSAPPPDPAEPPPPADPVAGPVPAHGSTGSHRPDDPKPSLSDLVRNSPGPGRRVPSAADLTAHLAGVDDPPLAESDPDDAPTVITHPDRPRHGPGSSVVTVPPPPYVVGETPSLAGRRLGHFELIEAVGSGGMAAVLKARDQELGRVVALKILPPEAAADAEAVTRFKQEARAAARLDHENVARVYFCGEDQNLHFIAFEFVEGQTLRALIDRRGPLPAGECVRYMLGIAAGLNHAAERGVVHRDIKPSNVIVTPDGRAKIVDMGLARHLEAGSVNGGVTQSGVTLGTFDYISPEQALDPRRADARSDIYSLGCTFYHALTGRPPVPEGTAAKKLHAHQHEAPLDPRELNPAVPDDLAVVLSRMMAKDPARRYQTPLELIADLKAVAARHKVPLDGAVTDSAVKAVPAAARVLPEPPRLRAGWVIAGAVVVVVGAVLALSASGPSPAPAVPPWYDLAALPKDDPPPPAVPPVQPGPPPAAPADGVIRVRTAEQLAQALDDPATRQVELAGGETFDLTKLSRPVAYTGPELTLTAGPGTPPRVRLAAQAVRPGGDAPGPGTLSVRAPSLTVQGVWFEVVAGEAGAVGLAVADAGRVEFRDCVFLPDEAARRAGSVTAVAIGSAAEGGVKVLAERCVVGPVGVGLRVSAGAEVTVVDSGLDPTAAGVAATGPAAVRLDRSTFALDAPAAAVEAAGAGVRVEAEYCVFAPTGGSDIGFPAGLFARNGAVVRVVGEKADKAKVEARADRPNAVYRVDPVADATRGYSAADARSLMLPVAGAGWVELRQRPWDADGPALGPLAGPEPWRAFRLRL
ncbi:MAG: serine/threonine protein kinase, partial [Gemmataceae bacterium]|nr:serine/threonine protein kinase [Gemmataceae bacterium]